MVISNSADTFGIQYQIMKITAAWPEEHSTRSYKIKGVISLLITCTLGITMLIEAFSNLNNFAALSEILYILISVVVYNIQNISFRVQEKHFIKMIKMLKHSTFISYQEHLDHFMKKRIKSGRLLTQIFIFFVITCVLLMIISPFIENNPLPFPFPYDLGDYTPLMYIFQVVSILIVAFNHLSYDVLTACLMGISVTHLEILTNRLIEIKETSNNETNEDYEVIAESLKECIKYHTAIIEFIELIDQVFSFGIFTQFLGSAIIICNTVFYVVLVMIYLRTNRYPVVMRDWFQTSVGSSQFFMLINYIAVILAELFMYCWFGNEILWKSINVGEACYLSKWYECNKDINKYLFTIMERSKRPLKITALKVSTLSLIAFTSIIRWSYSYFTLLSNMYGKQNR